MDFVNGILIQHFPGSNEEAIEYIFINDITQSHPHPTYFSYNNLIHSWGSRYKYRILNQLNLNSLLFQRSSADSFFISLMDFPGKKVKCHFVYVHLVICRKIFLSQSTHSFSSFRFYYCCA